MGTFYKGKQAVVIGGSIAGMLAARVLSERFERVLVVERDEVLGEASPRKGAPQGHHAHLMLKKGGEILTDLFPDFYEELMEEHDARKISTGDLCWYHFGVWKMRYDSGLTTHLVSRPLLEAHMRKRLAACPQVAFRKECHVVALVCESGSSRVTGIRVEEAGTETTIPADLVVDAGGRGSNLPRFLSEIGYERPEEEHVTMNITYVSRLYERPEHASFDWEALVIYPTPPEETGAGYILSVEEDKWIVTLVGCAGEVPPVDDQGFLEFAKSLGRPDIHEALRDAKPLTPVHMHRVPSNQRRHYDKIRMPDNLVALGDAFCSFNPVYGQGMTVCAMEAELLGICLDRGTADLQGLSARFFKGAANLVRFPWLTATGEDFRYPATKGKKPFGTDALNRYKSQLFRLASHDRKVAQMLYELQFLIRNPLHLFHPYLVLQALKTGTGLTRIPDGERPPMKI